MNASTASDARWWRSGPGRNRIGPRSPAGSGAIDAGQARPAAARSPRRRGVIRSPAARPRPTTPDDAPGAHVEDEPRIRSAARPPANPTYARRPVGPPPKRTPAPAGIACTTPGASHRPSSPCAPRSAPVIAIAHASTARSSVPPSVTSSAAAATGAPARRFATASDHPSAAPERGTPRCARPGRPPSWTRSRAPGSTTSSTLDAAQAGTRRTRSPAASRAGRSPAGSHRRASVRPIRCQPPGVSNG